jgi:hypothetical protein
LVGMHLCGDPPLTVPRKRQESGKKTPDKRQTSHNPVNSWYLRAIERGDVLRPPESRWGAERRGSWSLRSAGECGGGRMGERAEADGISPALHRTPRGSVMAVADRVRAAINTPEGSGLRWLLRHDSCQANSNMVNSGHETSAVFPGRSCIVAPCRAPVAMEPIRSSCSASWPNTAPPSRACLGGSQARQ